jgi:hypothetical protein
MGPAVSCRSVDTCCRWCLVLKGVVVVVGVVVGTAAVKAVVTEALDHGVRALAGKERRWLVVTLLTLLSLV